MSEKFKPDNIGIEMTRKVPPSVASKSGREGGSEDAYKIKSNFAEENSEQLIEDADDKDVKQY